MGKMVVQYIVPNQVIEKFMERGKPKLAFLAGQTNGDGDVITVSHLVIPTQHEFRPESELGEYYSIILRIFGKIIKVYPSVTTTS